MSFLVDVKEEVLYLDNLKPHCIIAEMHSLLSQNFKINVAKNISLTLITENKYVAHRFCFLLKLYYNEPVEVKVSKNNHINRPYTYCIHFNDAEGFLTKNLMLKDNTFVFNTSDIIKKKCCKASYIRGEFFVGGAFSNPTKNYHLEFKKNDEKSAQKLQSILNYFNLNAKIVVRKSYNIVYIKEVDKISDFLKLIGAYNQVLNLESLYVLKDMKNNINRKQNCEMANLSKTITASVSQVRDINFIFENLGASNLPEDLIEIATLRLEFPDLSLIEIGNLHNPPISKSSVNYKFKKISKIAENLRRYSNEGKTNHY